MIVEIKDLVKRYGDFIAVDNIGIWSVMGFVES